MTLERPAFSTTSLREGYDTAEVDQAVDLILDNLALPELRFGADQITVLRFTPVRLQQGYDMGEVDSWLDLAAAETERRSEDGVEPEQRSAPVAAKAVAPAPTPTAPPNAIVDLDAARPDADSERVQLLVKVAVVLVVLVLFYVTFA